MQSAAGPLPAPTGRLLPPQDLRRTGPDLRLGPQVGDSPVPARLRVVAGSAPRGEAWQSAMDLTGRDPADLPPEGYLLAVTADGDGALAVLAGADAAGLRHGRHTLHTLLDAPPGRDVVVPQLVVRDWPGLSWRGVVEGFYGPPWTHADRLAHLDFAARCRLNVFVHAPKDDAFHRARWREPYPPEKLAELRELAATADAHGIRLVVALAPGLSMRYADPAEHATLAAKARQLVEAGVRSCALFFDDIPEELTEPADRQRFGRGPAGAAAAHAETCNVFAAGLPGGGDASERLLMTPTDYSGVAASPYRDRLARDLDSDVLVCWTGRDVVVGEVTRADIDAAAASLGHRLVLWDNFPVNDFAPERVFLGPLTGRTTDVAGAPLAGIVANPMPQAAASELSLATVAEYGWNPSAYDPVPAARRALLAVAGDAADGLAPLVAACSAWPPSDEPPPYLAGPMAAALAEGSSGAADRLRQLFGALAAAPERMAGDRSRLVADLRPWLAASAAMGRAGDLATQLLGRSATDADPRELDDLRERTRAALDAALAMPVDVLRPAVPAFVQSVLDRTAGE